MMEEEKGPGAGAGMRVFTVPRLERFETRCAINNSKHRGSSVLQAKQGSLSGHHSHGLCPYRLYSAVVSRGASKADNIRWLAAVSTSV